MLNERSRLPTAIKNIIVFVLGVLIIISLYRYIETELDNQLPFFIIYSDTMVPTLKINDLITIGDGNLFNNTKVGDIIVFKKPAGEDRIIVHRISEITLENGKRVIITKGDASPISIPGIDFPVKDKDFIGKVKMVVPSIGVIFKPPINYVFFGTLIAVVGFAIYLHERKKNLQK